MGIIQNNIKQETSLEREKKIFKFKLQ